MKKATVTALLSALLLLAASCAGQKHRTTPDYNIIPFPNELVAKPGQLVLKGKVAAYVPADSLSMGVYHYLKSTLANASIVLRQVDSPAQAVIRFGTDEALKDEAYQLNISPDGIDIKSNASRAGLFYGVQSLLRLITPEIYNAASGVTQVEIPAVAIKDAPRFAYRGAMMDVGRNFMPKEVVLRFIDLMAMYKMNRFHFHLTDDQGWRIEIKKYPKLTEVGSYRKQTQIGHSDDYYPRRYDGNEKRGFYTQDEIREIVKYASHRFITVIPEIEMPGHASAALASYPELSCGLGKTYVVRDYYDVFDEVFCPKEQTFAFLEEVLTEVMALFPSHYIHIGGDECPKKAWKKCNHCQALMKREGLKDEEALQSFFIHRIEQFVNSKGRNIIGWDEILEGGLAPNATVMSWRGEEGGIASARQKHRVIMTPGRWCYLDFYQEDPEFAPLAMGGFLPIDSVYAYNPIPAQLTPEEQTYIIGTQANVWGEYIQTPEELDYMAFPRLAALAEVQWTELKQKDFNRFARCLVDEFKRLDYFGVNACRNFYEVNLTGAWSQSEKAFAVSLQTFYPGAAIYYSLNDSAVDSSSLLYQAPVLLSEDATLYAVAYKDNKPLGKITHRSFAVNKATGCPYRCTPAPHGTQVNEGARLTDGIRGYGHNLRHWTGFAGDTLLIELTLHARQKISQVSIASVWRPWNTFWPASEMSVSVSTDGKEYVPVGSLKPTYDFSPIRGTRFPLSLSFAQSEAAFVQIRLLSAGLCPQGYYNEQQPSSLAIDEIEIH